MSADGEAIQPPTPSPRLLQLQPLRRPRPRVLGWGPSLTRRQRSLWSGQLEPMASDGPYGSSLDGPAGDADRAFMKDKPYREAIGDLLWIARVYRYDLQYAVNACSRVAGNPGPAH